MNETTQDTQLIDGLQSARFGDTVFFKSYEGRRRSGHGRIVDVWLSSIKPKRWCAALRTADVGIVCVTDTDITKIVREIRETT